MSFDPARDAEFDAQRNPYAPSRESIAGLASPHPTTLRHSGLGIASFVLALGCAFLAFAMIVVAGVMEVSTPGGIDEESLAAGLVGLAILTALFGSFVAFILGAAGLFQSQRKKIFAALGLIFSGLTLFGTGGLIVLGLSIG